MDGLLLDYDIIILNDGSNDNTQNLLKKFSNIEKIRILTNEKSSGIVNAFNQLYCYVEKDYFMLTPGDGQWGVEATQLLIDGVLTSPDFIAINGIRTNKREIYPFFRLFLSKVYCLLGDYFLKTKGSDPGSIKILPREVLNYPLKTVGLLQEIERLVIAKKLFDGGVLFIPVSWAPRISGKSSGAKLNLIVRTFFSTIGTFLFKKL